MNQTLILSFYLLSIGVPQHNSAALSPKCNFLKEKLTNITQKETDFVQASAFRSVSSSSELVATALPMTDYVQFVSQDEEYVAQRAILMADINSCVRGEMLSSPNRINALERSRVLLTERARKRWVTAGFEDDTFPPVAQQINSVFDAEEKSFYRTSPDLMDADVIKDYGDISATISNSALAPELKNVLLPNAKLMKYEEAGRLQETLTDAEQQGLGYAYSLGKTLEARAAAATASAAQAGTAKRIEEQPDGGNAMWGLLSILIAIVVVGGYIPLSYSRAKYKAFKTHAREVSFWFGAAHLVLWQPGETVVVLKNKKLLPMAEPSGGLRVVSAFKGEEYLGFVNCKTQFLRWDSDDIHTSDGLQVKLALGVWWKVGDSALFVRRISGDFQVPNERGNDLAEAATQWVENLTGSTVREHVNRLPAEKLISPYVKAYIQVGGVDTVEKLPEFSDLVLDAREKLNVKAHEYGIDVERLDVQKLTLPDKYQEKLEAVRVAFLDPHESRAKTEAQRIALEGLAGVIGTDRVGLIEILKHVNLSGAPAVSGVLQVLQPLTTGVAEQANKAISAPITPKPPLPSPGLEEKPKGASAG